MKPRGVTIAVVQYFCITSSALVAVGLAICYWLQPDWAAAATVYPVWLWPVGGIALVALGWNRRHAKFFWAVVVLWLLFAVSLVEELRSLLRVGLTCSSQPVARTLRVVSLNCAGGNPAAAAEVARYRPDIVLLQESPLQRDVEALGAKLYGSAAGVVFGRDASVVVHGQATAAILSRMETYYFSQGHAKLSSGLEIELISLRMMPMSFCMDLWSPRCWQDMHHNRLIHRQQMLAVAHRVREVPASTPLILGGDFNAPPQDAAVRLLKPWLHDTFCEGGTGWGNTIHNDLPVLRIDQIWISRHLRATKVVARKTVNSDHRIVVCDFTVEPN